MRDHSTPVAAACDNAGNFAGLFTERDYFNKGHIIEKLIRKGTPVEVSACMDKTIVPIAASNLHLAHKYMLQKCRRYVPISENTENNSKIFGALSIDELLRFYMASPLGVGSTKALKIQKEMSLGIVSHDHALTQQFEVFSGDKDRELHLRIRGIGLSEIINQQQIQLVGEGFDGILIDARLMEANKWAKLAYSWFKSGSPKRIGILSRPERLEGKIPSSLIHLMEINPAFHFFARPKSNLEVAKTVFDFMRVF
jgi:hypothetical protein